jgi:DASS family divalent anion:Na+ symporter
MAIASALGLHPLVIGLVVLISAEPFFFPYQNLMYLNLIQSTEGKLFSHEQAVKLAWLNIFIILTAILISVPFWKLMDLIR